MSWQKLDGRIVAALAILVLAPIVPTIAVMLIAGAGADAVRNVAQVYSAIAALLVLSRALEWYATSYRITDERVELRSGVVSRNHRSLPRERIRSVDLTADPVHRLLGLAVVKIGTGAQGTGELKLDAVAREEADRIRTELLPSTSDGQDAPLARLNPAWLLYSAVTLSMMLAVWGAIASAFGSLSDVLQKFGLYGEIGELFRSVPLWAGFGVPVAAVLLTGVLGAFLLSLELWWDFTLTREDSGTLRVRRGLLTRRSISLEEQRLRGVEVAEPLLLRWTGGARTNAIATGLSEQADGKNQPDAKTLLPPAPRAQAMRVAAAVLREPESGEPEFPSTAEFRPHPRAALRRRLTWGSLSAAPFAAFGITAAALGWIPWWLAVVVAALSVAVAAAFAVDAYRNLGHRLHGRFLLARRGSGLRRTVALQRSGIIGWRFEQSLFQRRAGLLDVVATTAAGTGRCTVPDVAAGAGLEFAEQTVPGLVAPFLEPSHPED